MSQTKAQLLDTLVASLLPASDSAVDIGSNAVRFANIYGDTLYGSGANLTGLNIVTDTSPQLGGNLEVNTKNILFGDSASASDDRLILGAGSDLQIFHNGTNSLINNTLTTGSLFIKGDSIQITSFTNTEQYIKGVKDGAVELYYDNSKKFETVGNGIKTEANLFLLDSSSGNVGRIKLGTSEDLQIYHDGSDSYIDEAGTGDLIIQSSHIVFKDGGTQVFETTNSGVRLLDNIKLVAGSGNDLEIFHSGSNSFIKQVGTGDLYLQCDNGETIFLRPKANEDGIKIINDGAVELYHDNIKKFETHIAGEYGSFQALNGNNGWDGMAVAASKFVFMGSNSDEAVGIWNDQDNEWMVKCVSNAETQLQYNGSMKFETTSTGAHVIGTFEGDNFKVSNPGNNAVLIQNPANGIIGFGANNQTNQVIITADGHLSIPVDDKELRFGASDDLKIYHSGNFNFIVNYNSKNLAIQAKDGENAIVTVPDGTVQLYYDNSKKFETTSAGIDVTGRVTTDELTVEKASGNLSTVINAQNGLGTIEIGGSTGAFIDLKTPNSDDFDLRVNSDGALTSVGNMQLNVAGSENGVRVVANGDVELYYDNAERFNTGSQGCSVVAGGLNVQRGGTAHAGAIYFAGFGDTNHMLWQDYFDNPNGTRGTGNGFDGIKWNCYNGVQLFHGNEAETIAKFLGNGACELYYDNSKKLNTHPNGIFVQGIYPMADNTYNIGSGSERFNTIFATNSSINTSDITEKNTIVNSDLGLDFINKLNPISYKWNKDDGKTHYGLIAQDVEETLISIGKTVSDFGGIHKEDNSPMGLGYSELIAPLIKAVQELSAEVAELKAA